MFHDAVCGKAQPPTLSCPSGRNMEEASITIPRARTQEEKRNETGRNVNRGIVYFANMHEEKLKIEKKKKRK